MPKELQNSSLVEDIEVGDYNKLMDKVLHFDLDINRASLPYHVLFRKYDHATKQYEIWEYGYTDGDISIYANSVCLDRFPCPDEYLPENYDK